MSKAFHLDSLAWEPVRTDVARQVYGKTLLDELIKIVYTHVKPGGGFSAHQDRYGHLLVFLGGTGIAGVGKEEFPARAGLVVHVSAGDEHFFRNTGDDDLVLISLNLPDLK
jgi:quercetin dioxygenase-like cupin family protein